MSSNTILVFSEKPVIMNELLGAARRQSDDLGWSVSAIDLTGGSEDLGEYGADVVYKADTDASNPDEILSLLAAAIQQSQPNAFLIGATKMGLEVAPRLAERFDSGYAAWVVGFKIDSNERFTTAQAMLYTGTGVATYKIKPGFVILAIPPGIFDPVHVSGKNVKSVDLEIPQSVSKIKILENKPKQAGESSLEAAKFVVVFGQGVQHRDDLEMMHTVAELLEGQLACSRPIASDRDWFPDWLGLSGAKVKPELCLTIGVSGAIQHIIGIRDSRLIAAINNDENAPIFSQADYGIVADLYEFLPAFIERLKSREIKAV